MDLSDFGIHPDFGLQMHKYVRLQAFWSGFKIDNFPKSAIFRSVHFDLITQEINTEEVFMQVLGPISGGWCCTTYNSSWKGTI